MHPAVSLAFDHGYKHHHLAAPLLFTFCASIANVYEPVQHSLFITAISWGIIWLPAAIKTTIKTGLLSHVSSKGRRTSWLAGALLALAHICDSAACDKEGTWATKVIPTREDAECIVDNHIELTAASRRAHFGQ
jgi:hypothetical protein